MIIAYCDKCKKKHEGNDFGVLMWEDIVECPSCSSDGKFHFKENKWAIGGGVTNERS